MVFVLSVEKLSSLSLPDSSDLRRDWPRRLEILDADFQTQYDRQTLFYDVFYDPDSASVKMIGPTFRKTLNAVLTQAVFKIDGTIFAHKVYDVGGRTSCVEINSGPLTEDALDRVSVRLFHPKLPKQKGLKIRPSSIERFAGRNAMVAVSKNNRLKWIHDWLEYHVDVHGADSVILFDNGSDMYKFRHLRRTIERVPGIKDYAVIHAPFMFGPVGKTRYHHNSRFFQLTMLRIAQERFLRRANAVLSVDIDELVLPDRNGSIFEAVKSSPLGFVSIQGKWAYAARPSDDGVIRHADHVWQRKGRDRSMDPKWCVDPSGPLKDNYWRLHGITEADRDFSMGYRFLHCRQITTGWDYARDFEDLSKFERLSETALLHREQDKRSKAA